ncbi:hypothetical protein [Leptothrix ochracea]|uniref:hypothetical protein n=2 Tax=Leptothrix ochracea TaxID=735331 RepID=UPI0034E1D387
MNPFADNSSSESLDELTMENRSDRFELYGSLSITRDQQGLARARALRAVLDQAIQALEAAQPLPEQLVEPPTEQVSNPFAD